MEGFRFEFDATIESFDSHFWVILQIGSCWKDMNPHEHLGFAMGHFTSLSTTAQYLTVRSQVRRSGPLPTTILGLSLPRRTH
jgi:hypothetical protein